MVVLVVLALAACGDDGRTGKMIEWHAGTPPAANPAATPAPGASG